MAKDLVVAVLVEVGMEVIVAVVIQVEPIQVGGK